MTEAEKRERRALERKLSEMEEELKVSQTIDFLSFFFIMGVEKCSSFSYLYYFIHIIFILSGTFFYFAYSTREAISFYFL